MRHWFTAIVPLLILIAGCATGEIRGDRLQGAVGDFHNPRRPRSTSQTTIESPEHITAHRSAPAKSSTLLKSDVLPKPKALAAHSFVRQISYQPPPNDQPGLTAIGQIPTTEKDDTTLVPSSSLESNDENESDDPIGWSKNGALARYQPTQWQGVELEDILQTALRQHPTIAKAQARLDALQGKHLQKGLPNNPRVGLTGSDINEDGKLGRIGGVVGRTVVRNGKRQSDQSIVIAEIQLARQQLAVARQRLMTDVKQQFSDVLVAQEQTEMARRLVGVATHAAEVSQRLFEAQEVARVAVVQSELELEKSKVSVRRLANQHVAAKRKLAALIGEESLPTENVAGNVAQSNSVETFEQSYDELLERSPALGALFSDIERARRVANRERLETVSDLNWQTTFEYDTVEDNLIGGFQVTWKIPTLNQNQGAIYAADREVIVARQTADTKALQLRQQLATEYEHYIDAQIQVTAFEGGILPRSAEALELLLKGYAAGETELLQVLIAQRTFFQTHVEYLENVRKLRRQTAKIRGLLLSDSLNNG